jgi:hypothetical protein
MAELLDPPVTEAPSASRKRRGGPRTLLGRMRARENAVGESLFSKVVFSRKMAISILDRNVLLSSQFPPRSQYEVMLVANMALARARMDRVAVLQVDNCDHSIDRYTKFWREGQEARALKLLARLPKDPPQMAHALSGFKQGAELMIQRWQGLAAVAASGVDWDEEQGRLSLDLRGIPVVLRAGNSTLLPPAGDTAGQAALAVREIARLQEKLESWLDEQDVYSQEEALAGLAPEVDPTTKRLDRYEAIFKRDYQKAEDELTRVRKEGEAKSNGVVTGLRAWDVDPLIQRIKNIERPPALSAETEDMLGSAGWTGEPLPVAKASGTAAVIPDPQPVVTPPPAPATAACAAENENEGSLTPPAVTTATQTAPPLAGSPVSTTVAMSILTSAPMNRRERKAELRRLHQAAYRTAGERGQ